MLLLWLKIWIFVQSVDKICCVLYNKDIDTISSLWLNILEEGFICIVEIVGNK